MSEKPKRARPKKRVYTHRTNAVSVTIYSQDGSPVPRAVINEASEAVVDVARRNNLLIGVNEA